MDDNLTTQLEWRRHDRATTLIVTACVLALTALGIAISVSIGNAMVLR